MLFLIIFYRQIKSKIPRRIVVADVLDHRADQFHIVRQQPVFHFLAEDVAENAAEVFVPRVGQERAAVGQHADEAAQEPQVRQRVHLFLHAVFLIQEPPAGAELHFAGHAAVLKVADHRGDNLVVGRIDVIENRFGQPVVAIQAVEELYHRLRAEKVADRIETGIRSERLEHARVVVSQYAVVELLGPAFFVVHQSELMEHGRFEF